MAEVGVDLSNQVILRWDSASGCAALLESGGIDAVWLRNGNEPVASACRAAGKQVIGPNDLRLVPLAEAGAAPANPPIAIKSGVWPGSRAAQSRGSGAFVAGATSRAWVDANGYLIACLRALYPKRPPLLGYLPDAEAGVPSGTVVPFDSLELALVEAWTAGGNYLLAPDDAFRDALLAGKDAAMSAWQRLGRTARWLKQNRELFTAPRDTAISVLVEPGEATSEVAALLYRHNAAPDVIAAEHAPAPDPATRPVLVAAGIHAPPPALGRLLLSHVRSGATVVTDACDERAWWRDAALKLVRSFEDREYYSLAAGHLLAYKEPIADPGELALDVLDLAAGRRAARVWEMSAAIVTAFRPAARKATLCIVNYGSPARNDVLARVRGSFASARVVRPESDPLALRVYRRGRDTEVMVPALTRVAVVEFAS